MNLAGEAGWPPSAEVAAELRRLDPARYGGMKSFHYTPGTGKPRSAVEVAAAAIAADATARMMFGGGIYATREIAEARVAEYANDPDYTVSIEQLDAGPKAGQWRTNVKHKDWKDI